MKANDQHSLPPFCLACDIEGKPEEIWAKREDTVEQLFRGETFSIAIDCFVCKHCGFKLAQEGEAEALVHKTREQYRERHGLLAPGEIIARRKKLGLSQKRFADHLHVGLASIKRWEAGAVQDKSSDQLIRQLTDDKDTEAFCQEVLFDLISGAPVRAEAMKLFEIIEHFEKRTDRRDSSYAPSIARAVKLVAAGLKPKKELKSKGAFSLTINQNGRWVEIGKAPLKQRENLIFRSRTTIPPYALSDSA